MCCYYHFDTNNRINELEIWVHEPAFDDIPNSPGRYLTNMTRRLFNEQSDHGKNI